MDEQNTKALVDIFTTDPRLFLRAIMVAAVEWSIVSTAELITVMRIAKAAGDDAIAVEIFRLIAQRTADGIAAHMRRTADAAGIIDL